MGSDPFFVGFGLLRACLRICSWRVWTLVHATCLSVCSAGSSYFLICLDSVAAPCTVARAALMFGSSMSSARANKTQSVPLHAADSRQSTWSRGTASAARGRECELTDRSCFPSLGNCVYGICLSLQSQKAIVHRLLHR